MAERLTPETSSPPLIPEYFAGREVFITGATGFMGKVLVERLLWTCPDVSRLHLLMRQKKGLNPEERLEQLKQSQVFDVIRNRCRHQLDKLSIAPGDLTKPKFGMDPHGYNQLSNVSVVFHVAATVKFNEPLKVAVQQNLRSVLTLLDICDQLPNIQVLVYVSTAYSNADLQLVEEKVYDPPAQLQQVLALVDALPDHTLEEVTPGLISPKPNTYTFTKAMAESAVHEHARTAKYSMSIFRPTIVISSYQNPFPGWIENLNGPTGVLVSVGKGLLHVLSSDPKKRADIIPVDTVIDTLIAVAWETGVDNIREARVYHCSSYENGITWGEFNRYMVNGVRNHPLDTPTWYPFLYLTGNRHRLHKVLEATLQTIPLNLMEYVSRGTKTGTRLNPSNVSKRLNDMNEALKFFASREWYFATENTQKLKNRLSPEDSAVYNLDVTTIDWEVQVTDFVKGARKYLLKEKDQDIYKAIKRVHMLHVVHKTTILLLAVLGTRLAVWFKLAILRIISRLLEMRENFRMVKV